MNLAFHRPSFQLYNRLQNHCIDWWDCIIPLRRKIDQVENVVKDILVVDDVVAIDVVAVDAIDDHVRFNTYYWVDFYHQS